jgi:aspartate/methionine/tyrosine aminotransferase
MFSRRLPADAEVNALTRAMAALTARGTPYIDLTESNPTRVGLAYPPDLLRPLADARALRYDPQPLGLAPAREAVAGEAARRGVHVDPAHVVLTASTSEAYSWIFKLLCDPGDSVLVPRPSYPLFEHLARLEDVRLVPYALDYHGRWEIDVESMASAPAGTRAVLIVSPNNPTGSFASGEELARLADLCRDRGWALVADEVFADYVLEARGQPVTDVAAQAHLAGALSFTLGGASKSLGLPQLKLGWIVAGGPPALRDAALAHLELIADTYLSVGTAVQVAAPALLREGALIRQRIQERIASNLRRARHLAAAFPACDILPVEGGWSAVVRVPATRSEERLVLDLLDRERVLVHPGYFFDFPHEAYLVVSLLPPGDELEDALSRVLRLAHG